MDLEGKEGEGARKSKHAQAEDALKPGFKSSRAPRTLQEITPDAAHWSTPAIRSPAVQALDVSRCPLRQPSLLCRSIPAPGREQTLLPFGSRCRNELMSRLCDALLVPLLSCCFKC